MRYYYAPCHTARTLSTRRAHSFHAAMVTMDEAGQARAIRGISSELMRCSMQCYGITSLVASSNPDNSNNDSEMHSVKIPNAKCCVTEGEPGTHSQSRVQTHGQTGQIRPVIDNQYSSRVKSPFLVRATTYMMSNDYHYDYILNVQNINNER
jgi:hypothetical protein